MFSLPGSAVHREPGVSHDEHPAAGDGDHSDCGETGLRGLVQAPRGHQGQQRPLQGPAGGRGHGEYCTRGRVSTVSRGVVTVSTVPEGLLVLHQGAWSILYQGRCQYCTRGMVSTVLEGVVHSQTQEMFLTSVWSPDVCIHKEVLSSASPSSLLRTPTASVGGVKTTSKYDLTSSALCSYPIF